MESFPPWMYNQSGVIPFRLNGDDIEILLITSRSKKNWIIPKGIIDPGLTPRESAVREAYEEAGVRGRIFPEKIGEYEFGKWNGTCRVQVFPFEVTEELETWPESCFRERKWLGIEKAAKTVKRKALKTMIERVGEIAGKKD